MSHLFEFKERAISRENVWLDTGSIIKQLAGDATIDFDGALAK